MTTLGLSSIVACSLDANGAAARAADFRALLAPNLRGLERTGTSAILDLQLGLRAERSLAELLRLERECCPFWRFELTRRSPRRVTLAAAGLWWFGDRRWVLGLVALFCLGFAVLDGIEVSRKWGDEATIAVLALLALVLHAAAGAVAASSAKRLTRSGAHLQP